jgi:hypothetical protein
LYVTDCAPAADGIVGHCPQTLELRVRTNSESARTPFDQLRVLLLILNKFSKNPNRVQPRLWEGEFCFEVGNNIVLMELKIEFNFIEKKCAESFMFLE